MAGNSKLDMSLDDLIKKQKPKPGGKGKPLQQKQQGKGGAQQQQQQRGGFKPKGAGQQQQTKGTTLKAKGGVAKPGAGGRPGPGKFAQQQTRPGQQRMGKGGADVRVVPRPGAGPRAGAGARPGIPSRTGPRPGAGGGPNFRSGGPRPMMGGPRAPFMAGPMMGMNPMQMQQQLLQQQMMAQQMMQPAAVAAPAAATVPPAQGKWESDLFDGSVVTSSTSAKLLISNLDFKVTDEDIKELFGTVGPIKESAINYDKSGRSMGTATVVFEKRGDALAAFNRYNNVSLDNKKMMIEVVETAVPRGTFKTLSSGINVSRQTPTGGSGVKGRGVPHGDFMQE